jgi:thiol-disulfide isomerase/thioredoxin
MLRYYMMKAPLISRFASPLTVVAALQLLPAAFAQTKTPPQPPVAATQPVPIPTLPTAQALLDAALVRATAQKKAVLVVFHASWCGWCHRLDDKLLNDPATRKLISDQYEVVHVDVMENGDKKPLENAGGGALMAKWGGEKSGLPYFLDGSGKKLADSNVMPPGKTNIGYPGAPDEIAAFENLLKQTAPRMSEGDRAQIVAQLKKNAPVQ